MNRFTALLIVLALGALLPASALANCGAAADRDPAVSGASVKAARSATLCLLNVQRRAHAERRLRFNHKLALAGLRHARDMVSHKYFAHDAPSGFAGMLRSGFHFTPGISNFTISDGIQVNGLSRLNWMVYDPRFGIT